MLAGTLLACSVGVAAADPVVSATVYPGGGGTITHPTVSFSILANCPFWNGSQLMGLYGTNGNYINTDSPGADAWALKDVLTCGLSISLSQITYVVVQRSDGSFVTKLAPSLLTDSSQYQDPHGDGRPELPVLWSSEGGGNVGYIRPWEGGTDDNAADWIPQGIDSTIAIEVFENGSSPLDVTASNSTPTATGSVSFTASVAGFPPSQLTWDWNFGDGQDSSAQDPVHTYSSSGKFTATLLVTDTQTGQAGNANLLVNVPSSSVTGPTPTTGAGSTTPANGLPTGPTKSKGNSPGGAPGKTPTKQSPSSGAKSKHHRPTNKGATHSRSHKHKSSKDSSAATTPTAGQGGSSGPAASGGASGGAGASAQAQRSGAHASAPKRGREKSADLGGGRSRLVSGRLISDLVPIAPDRSPLVHVVRGAATAPQVRRDVVASVVPAILAGLLVVLLFFLGAGRELVWRGGWRPLVLGRMREAVPWF
ncbi:MAG TPA: PKD domain-containing protein [Solirubrobacteraceae bacterium]